MIRFVALITTLLVGFFYTRNEVRALVKCVTEKDYVSWYELNKEVETLLSQGTLRLISC